MKYEDRPNTNSMGQGTIDDQDWFNQLNEQFIEPLEKLGFTFQSYIHTWEPEGSWGHHILRFDEDLFADSKWTSTDLSKICEVDDDSQPFSTYRYYAGTLILYIPYSS